MQPSSRTVRTGDTPVGRGVFSLIHFARDHLIGEIRGATIHDRQYESDYCMELAANLILEPNAPFCYLNHSCEPNCSWSVYNETDPDTGRVKQTVLLWATRDVKAGDELTIDYGWKAADPIRCHCGSAKCRGWIVAEKEIPDLKP